MFRVVILRRRRPVRLSVIRTERGVHFRATGVHLVSALMVDAVSRAPVHPQPAYRAILEEGADAGVNPF